jgi:hypothetical protein
MMGTVVGSAVANEHVVVNIKEQRLYLYRDGHPRLQLNCPQVVEVSQRHAGNSLFLIRMSITSARFITARCLIT